jgi:hypothetical protein
MWDAEADSVKVSGVSVGNLLKKFVSTWKFVIPAKAGIQKTKELDSGLRPAGMTS